VETDFLMKDQDLPGCEKKQKKEEKEKRKKRPYSIGEEEPITLNKHSFTRNAFGS